VDPVNVLTSPLVHIVDDFHDPDVVIVTDCSVAVTRHFVILLGQGSRDIVGVDIAASCGVNEADAIVVLEETDRCRFVVVRFSPGRHDVKVVVVVLVMVAGHLLLIGSNRVRLNVRV
jgi:hypothetical protein